MSKSETTGKKPGRKIWIPPKLYDAIAGVAQKKGLTVDQEVNERLERISHESGNRFNQEGPLPRRAYAIARIRKTEMKKLRGWLDKKDPIEVATDGKNGLVYLFNGSKIFEHHIQRQSISVKEQLIETEA
jgi:hypothetical protein